jgi:hypothetical protein
MFLVNSVHILTRGEMNGMASYDSLKMISL